jgi:hypothetical protein
VLAISLPIASAHAYDWLQFGGDAQHSGRNTAETAITRNNVSALTQKYQVTLTATADGAPVFLEAVSTQMGTKDLLFVTTSDGRIIALDAQTGAQVWTHQYGPGTCQINRTGGPCYTTSSPAIDPNRQYVYSYGLDGNVHKYQVGDGTETIDGLWPQPTTLKGFDEKGSSALAIATSNGTTYLYVVHGGYPGDNGDYQGHVTAINLGTGAQKVFNAACSDQAVHFKRFADGVPPICSTPRNAIWSRPGVIYDAGTDRIFMGTGNGVYDGNNSGHNWSESVIALHPDGSGGTGINAGKPLDSYTAANFQALDNGDTDLGSTAPAILPVPANSIVQHLAVQGGKDAKLRLINLANLSGNGGPGYVGGEVGTIINVPQGGVVLTQPTVWVNTGDGTTWVFVVNGNGASGLQLIVDVNGNPSLAARWQNVQGGSSAIVANNMVFSISGSTVRALDPLSGNVLWSLARSGGFHWESLIVANGAVYATDGSNRLTAYAIAPQSTTTTLTSSANPAAVGASVTFTATVMGTNPTGNVNFTDGGTSIAGCAAVALSGSGNTRTAACSTSNLSAGTHSIVAAYGGDAGNAPSSSTVLSQVINTGTDVVWVDDAVPAGAILASDGGDAWTWISSNPTPYSGSLAHQSMLAAGEHQHYFYNTTGTLAVATGDTLFAYVYLDPVNPPSEVMLQWYDGSWEHRAYWGANLIIGWGTDGTVSRRYMGVLPAIGQWIRLAVPAAQVGLEGSTLNGMAYTLYGGRATWDYAGKTAAGPTYQVTGTVTLSGSALSGVNFAATGGVSCTSSDATGGYACTVPQGWSGTVTPSLSGYTFTPPSRSYSSVAANQTAQNYTAATSTGTTTVWVEDAAPAGATQASDGGDAWNWIGANPAPYSGALAHQSTLAGGEHQHYFYNATATLAVATGDTLFAYVYLDPVNPPSEVMLQWFDGSWEHRAYWGANLITGWGTDGTVSRRFMGPLPATGQWVRLAVPAAQVGLEGRTLNGMAYTLYGGRSTWDYAGKTAGGPVVWVEDGVPAGATLASDGGDAWNWISANPAPYSGTLAHQSTLAAGEHQHYFYNATATLAVAVGDSLFAYVYLDPVNPPSEVMLQWYDGSWEHRAYWGANLIGWGTDGSVSRRYMGVLPAAGQWVRLSVAAAQVGLEGRTLNGMAYTLYNGRATWDYAGK